MYRIDELKIGSFFAGVGGIDLGFIDAGFPAPVYANEFDKYAGKIYQQNFSSKATLFDSRDICDISISEVPVMDIIYGGFPCQAFSIAGLQKGFQDTRGTMFFEMVRFIKAFKPKVVFAENVKNLEKHDNGNTFKIIKQTLENEGYTVLHKIMNACDYSKIPQNRERIYIVAFLNKENAEKFKWPDKEDSRFPLEKIIDFKEQKDEKFYYRKGKFSGDIYEKLEEAMDDNRAIYQWRRTYVRKNKSGLIPTLTANQGGGGHNVGIIRADSGDIRKMTPRECFNAQGFPKTFNLNGVSNSQLYKQAGNSVCIPVITKIAEKIKEALE